MKFPVRRLEWIEKLVSNEMIVKRDWTTRSTILDMVERLEIGL